MQTAQSLIRHFPWTPTQDQEEAFLRLARFIENFEKTDCFVLAGYAGTGKTTLISTLVKALPAFRLRTVLLAPTGKAAKVMSQYAGKQALTIHKKIYRKKKALSLDLSFELAHNAHQDTLFIVDEASMISHERISYQRKSLLEDLVSYVRRGDSCRLLFVGDTAQLPPVGYQQSPAMDVQVLASLFGMTGMGYELTEVVRQARLSGILANATLIREQIHQSADDPSCSVAPGIVFPKFRLKGYQDIFRMGGERLIEGLHYAYSKFGMENTIVICRSNKHANLYNQHIRNQILLREEELSGGDYVMVVRNNYFWSGREDESSGAFIANGDMARVRRVRNIHEQYGFRFADVSLEFEDMDEARQILDCRVLLDTLHTDSPNLPQEQQTQLYNRIIADYAEEAKDSKQRMELLRSDPYYNALQLKFAMAVTCHKAQGGQWECVFVDQGFLQEDAIDREFLRWLYTACTRATKELFLVNFHEKFFS